MSRFEGRPERLPKRLEDTLLRLQRAAGAHEEQSLAPLRHWTAAPPRRGMGLPATIAVSFVVLFAALFALRRGAIWLALGAVILVVLVVSWLRRAPVAATAPGETFVPDDELLRTEQTLAAIAESLRRAPAPVRAFAEDVERGLRGVAEAARTLAKRQWRLSRVLAAQSSRAFEEEHLRLLERRDGSVDAGARQILDEAVAQSELRRRKLGEVAKYGERFAAERLRIRHAVESLHLDVERAIAADFALSEGRLAESFGRLTDEIAAIADALEEASAPPTTH